MLKCGVLSLQSHLWKLNRERNKTGKTVLAGARSGCDTHKYRGHVEVVVLSSADVGPCPQISAFQQAIKQGQRGHPLGGTGR